MEKIMKLTFLKFNLILEFDLEQDQTHKLKVLSVTGLKPVNFLPSDYINLCEKNPLIRG